jgi:hypothetical protein
VRIVNLVFGSAYHIHLTIEQFVWLPSRFTKVDIEYHEDAGVYTSRCLQPDGSRKWVICQAVIVISMSVVVAAASVLAAIAFFAPRETNSLNHPAIACCLPSRSEIFGEESAGPPKPFESNDKTIISSKIAQNSLTVNRKCRK